MNLQIIEQLTEIIAKLKAVVATLTALFLVGSPTLGGTTANTTDNLLEITADTAQTAYLVCPYKRRVNKPDTSRIERYPLIDDFTPQIRVSGGDWAETEILGNRAIVKVKTTEAVLNSVVAAGCRRLPLSTLASPLSSLTRAELTAIQNEVTDAGYSLAEIRAAIPDFKSATMGDVLKFLASRRKTPRYDAVTDQIYFDGEITTPKKVEIIDLLIK